MVSDVNERTLDRRARERAAARAGSGIESGEVALRVLGVAAMATGAVSLVFFAAGETTLAFAIAAVGAVLALIDLAFRPHQRRYAIAGLMFSVVGMSYCVALMLWGSAG